MTLFDRMLTKYNLTAICDTVNCILYAIDLIDYIVCIYCKCTLNGYILGRHGCRCLTPTAKGMTLFDRMLTKYNLTAICDTVNCILYAIDLVGYSIVVYCKHALYYNILGRHCGRSLAPTAKGVALLDRCINQCDFAAINYRNNLVLFAVNLVNDAISIDCKRAFYDNILGGHCGRCFTPTTKGMTFLGRILT